MSVGAVLLVVYKTPKISYDLWNSLFAFKIVRNRFDPFRVLFHTSGDRFPWYHLRLYLIAAF